VQSEHATQRPALAIVSPVRAEAPYLMEWIAYHRMLGVSGFVLADNDGDDGTSELLCALDRAGIIVRIDLREARYFQLAFYDYIINTLREINAGLFFIDVDEFLRPENSSQAVRKIAQEWLADSSISAVGLNWAIYGSSGRESPGEGLVIERFSKRALTDFDLHRHVKTFVRAKTCVRSGGNPHYMELSDGRYVNTRGEDMTWDSTLHPGGIAKQVVWDNLRVDHYVLKSRKEFERKKARGDVASEINDRGRQPPGYFSALDRNDVEDPASPNMIEATKAEMAELERRLASVL
jgi:hypothetical protein